MKQLIVNAPAELQLVETGGNKFFNVDGYILSSPEKESPAHTSKG